MAVQIPGNAGDSTTATTGSATSLTISKPTNTADGDLLVAWIIGSGSTGTVTAPSGWTLVFASTSRRGGLYYKSIPSASAETATTYTWSTFTTGSRIAGTILRMTGVSLSTPIDVVSSAETAGASGSVTIAAISPANSSDLLLGLVFANPGSSTGTTFTFPGGWTNTGINPSANTGAAPSTVIGLGYKQLSASGSTGTAVVAGTGTPSGTSTPQGILATINPSSSTYSGTGAWGSSTALAPGTPQWTSSDVAAMLSSTSAFTSSATLQINESTGMQSASALSTAAPSDTDPDTSGMSSVSALSVSPSLTEAVTASMSSVSAMAGSPPALVIAETAGMTSASAFANTPTSVLVATVGMTSVTALASSVIVIFTVQALLTNDFETGTSGVAISTGNSGSTTSPRNRAFNTVIGGTYDNTRAMHGSISALFSTGSTATSPSVAWTPTTIATAAVRFYIYCSAAMPAMVEILRTYQGGVSNRWGLYLSPSGALSFAPGNAAGVACGSIPNGQWTRVEVFGTQTSITIQTFVGDSTTPATSQVVNADVGGGANVVSYGVCTSVANVPSFWMDDVAFSPYSTAIGPTTSYGGMVSPTAFGAADAVIEQFTSSMTSSTSAFGGTPAEIEVGTVALTSATALAAAATLLEAVSAGMTSVSSLAEAPTLVISPLAAMSSPTAFAAAASLVLAATESMTSATAFAASASSSGQISVSMSSVSSMSSAFGRTTAGGVACASISAFALSPNLIAQDSLAWTSVTNLLQAATLAAVASTVLRSVSAMAASAASTGSGTAAMTSISSLAAVVTLQGPEMSAMASATVFGISVTVVISDAISMLSATAISGSVSLVAVAAASIASISILAAAAARTTEGDGEWLSTTTFTALGGAIVVCSLHMLSSTLCSFNADLIVLPVASVLPPTVSSDDLWEQADGDHTLYVELLRQAGLLMPPNENPLELASPSDWG